MYTLSLSHSLEFEKKPELFLHCRFPCQLEATTFYSMKAAITISTRQSIGSARGTPKAPKKPSFDLSLIPTAETVGALYTGYSWKYFLSCNGPKVKASSVEKTAILVIIPSQKWKALRLPSFKITWHLLSTITLSNSCTPNSENNRNDAEDCPKIKYRARAIPYVFIRLRKVWSQILK